MDGNYTAAWIIWLAMFIAIEGTALANRKDGDTLSEHVWAWFSIKGKTAGWKARRATLLAGLVWLVGHFMGRW